MNVSLIQWHFTLKNHYMALYMQIADVGYDRNKQKSYCLLKVIVRQLVKIKGYRCCQEKMLKK